jgi:hypothetical protein
LEQDELFDVGGYERTLAAGLARMRENALDWAHLPHLHSSSFSTISLVDESDAGWRATATAPGSDAAFEVALALAGEVAAGAIRWTTETRAGGQLFSRIVTDAFAAGPRACRIAVRFFSRQPGTGEFFRALYARLYDEDEAMMIARQKAIDAPDSGFRNVRGYRIPHACPHLGLPLDAEPDTNGIITCPWHGYRFDAATGRCVSGQDCRWQMRT